MNAVRQGNVTARDAEAVEIVDVAQPCLLLNQRTLGPILGSMGMNHHATLAREFADFLEQLASTTNRKTRRKAVPDAAFGFTMPLLKQRDRLFNRCGGLLVQSFRHFVAFIHHALADGRAETR